MAVEAIKKVTEIEQESKKLRDAAVTEGKQKVLLAQRAGQRTLEDTRVQAEHEVRQMMIETEEEAAQLTKRVMKEAQGKCEVMKQRARENLDQAAALIVEKVVNS